MFLDEAKIYVRSGDGGAGIVAFRREKYVPRGGPAGGDGGKGGDIIITVNPRLRTLSHFRSKIHFKATTGQAGGNFNRTGAQGSDCLVEVPPGTIIREAGSEIVLADLVETGQEFIVAHGGRGGAGNARFKSSTNQTPRIAEKGEPGEEHWLHLELKLLADVGIIGIPNAGKSTLLSVISAARPKIADYPFTTITPNLGVIVIGDREIVVADIPGLVEGAHLGVGLGQKFLRHIQRTKLLIHLVSGSSADPVGEFNQIMSELEEFDPELALKPQIIVLSKLDLPEAEATWKKLSMYCRKKSLQCMKISSATHLGIKELVSEIAHLLDIIPAPLLEKKVPLLQPAIDEKAFEIVREAVGYRVRGKYVERVAAMTYWEYDEAVQRFQKTLNMLGIADALREQGAKKGDTVFIGDIELEWAE
jgi:GTP-binding protein